MTARLGNTSQNNLYAYCENNPLIHKDDNGNFFDTVFDIVSLGISIAEVASNPGDPWAWAGLAGDVIDLIPFVTGVGEITRGVKTVAMIADSVDDVADVVKVANKADDVVGVAKKIYKSANASSDLRKATGYYEIMYKSGKNYVGKGGFGRSIKSAERYVKKFGDTVTSIKWKRAADAKSAFISEYRLMAKRGVNNLTTYNKIWSPGRNYYRNSCNRLFLR